MSDYLTQLKSAYRSKEIIWIISALVVLIICWATFSSIDEVVVGQGSLVPSSSVQKIQSLDGGILRSLHVQEGDHINKGQLLVTLDETRAKASVAEAASEQLALQAKRIRLMAELNATKNHTISYDQKIAEHDVLNPALMNEAASYLANLKELGGKVEKANEDIVQQNRDLSEALRNLQTMHSSLKLLDDEIIFTTKAVNTGALSAAELRKLERERVNVAGKIESEKIQLGKLRSMVTETDRLKLFVFDEFRGRIRRELSDTDARLARLKQMLTGLNSQLDETKLLASMAGSIKSIELPSIGGVIRPGETIMQIVPEGDQLWVEAKVSPKDVGRLRNGQAAIVKFSAYDFVIYGGLKGELIHISPDAITDEQGQSFFKVHVAAKSGEWQQESWQDKPLIPGMQAQVDILSGKKTILQYWLKPLLRARANSMREP